MSDLQYPVGKFVAQPELNESQRREMIESLALAPARLHAAIADLSAAQLDTPYRPGGWTVRQVVHHMADSHLNASVRLRLALTEDGPAIKSYDEKQWAELADARTADPAVSLALLEALHQRWVALLKSLSPAQYARTMLHPEAGEMTIDRQLQLYEWHSRHHIAHITALRRAKGW